ncbi:MAG TPA: serine/threonine protein kinase [Xanthobacteraceae bacterium]|nr:serine/threonine protein kinase [Xanthobacteraceae bacterium]
MAETSSIPSEIGGRWRPQVVLKRDLFSTVERGRFVTASGEVDAVLRRIDHVPWWTRPLARFLFVRERNALIRAGTLQVAPALLFAGHRVLVRSWIRGTALHIAKPQGDRAYFRSAKAALRALHRAGICHNDLAKEQNWLRGADGRAYLTDFQLALCFRRRGPLYRLAAYEDLRHLLKHKSRYVPEALTAAERRVLARKSWPTRIWMASGKKIYYLITRGAFRFVDREGGGRRMVEDAPAIANKFLTHPQVRDAAVVPFPDRRSGIGLYAFVEATDLTEAAAREFIVGAVGSEKAPERLQVVEALPRNASGHVRNEILQLVAMNQLDLIDTLIADETERATVARIVAERRNLRDRFAH